MASGPGSIAVIGSGTMGQGIAHVAALAGYDVRLHDVSAEQLQKALKGIDANLAGGVQRGKLREEERAAALSRIRCDPDLAAAVSGTSLVIEAVVENIDLKRKLFGELDQKAPQTTVLASNTSSLSIAKIAEAVREPQRVIGMHFFNPVHIMKLVEVVVHDRTSEAARNGVLETARRMGKEPIVVKDSPGFASSRLGVVLGLEAMRMVEQGVASAEDIDKAMELGYNHPMGPLKLTDVVGLDVRLAIAEHLHRELKSEQYRPPEILRAKVKAGELGKKAGRGFYDWNL